MLKTLLIKNIALIENQEIEFEKGLNIITGETGTGKSVIIGAIKLIKGDKASIDIIRQGQSKGIVEATFHLNKDKNKEIFDLLDEKGIDYEDDFLICKREIFNDGKSKASINMHNCTIGFLKQITELLIDISGQHEHQSLLRIPVHIDLLDEFASFYEIINEFKNIKNLRENNNNTLKELLEKQKEKNETIEFCNYAIKEISDIDPKQNEDEDLLKNIEYLTNFQNILTNCQYINDSIFDDSSSVMSLFETSLSKIDNIIKLDQDFENIKNEIEECYYKLENVKDILRKHIEADDSTISDLELYNERLDAINKLKKKYGNTIREILEYKDDCERKLEEINHNDEQIESFKNELIKITEDIRNIALKLSKKRQESAKSLDSLIKKELFYLGMEKANFITEFRYIEDEDSFLKISDKHIRVMHNGIDYVEFTFSANQGEKAKSLSKIASGGELSRVMLALKLIFSQIDRIPTLILDEIDSGIGGQIASKVGKKIYEASKDRQILCITHSPQIAALKSNHLIVTKSDIQGRTISNIKVLNNNEKINEIARMLGGENITDTTFQHAKELIETVVQ